MQEMLYWQAAVLGLVEGITEFLPISSTGHLILVSALLGVDNDNAKVFELVIQSGAMLAVVWEYRARFIALARDVTAPNTQRFVLNLSVAFLPLAAFGLCFGQYIKALLFKPVPVAIALIVGGVVMLWAERRTHSIKYNSVDEIKPIDAFKVGLAQALALIPGTSRSAATIIGGLLFGFSRRTATEFSFFLAVPTLCAAACYDLFRHRAELAWHDIHLFAIGLTVAFISAFLCIRWLMRFVMRHDFALFAWYRIVFGGIVLLLSESGLVRWVAG
jgi:undecaprenyl-diphosphatase